MLEANCAGMRTDIFFPPDLKQGRPGPRSDYLEREAREVCANRVVRPACRNYAIEERIEFGIFGGMSPGERRLFRRKRNVA